MSRVLFTSDWHLGHKAIVKYRPSFKSIEEHDSTLVENYKRVVQKRDTIYFFGDMCFTEESLKVIKDLPGQKKILIMGNHDAQHFHPKKLYEAFDEVIASKSYKGMWLTHIPIHESELRGKYCVHGHTHSAMVPDSRYINICVEHTYFTPVLATFVLEALKTSNKDYEIARQKRLDDRKAGKIEMEEM